MVSHDPMLTSMVERFPTTMKRFSLKFTEDSMRDLAAELLLLLPATCGSACACSGATVVLTIHGNLHRKLGPQPEALSTAAAPVDKSRRVWYHYQMEFDKNLTKAKQNTGGLGHSPD